jgi:hypothetical protein
VITQLEFKDGAAHVPNESLRYCVQENALAPRAIRTRVVEAKRERQGASANRPDLLPAQELTRVNAHSPKNLITTFYLAIIVSTQVAVAWKDNLNFGDGHLEVAVCVFGVVCKRSIQA